MKWGWNLSALFYELSYSKLMHEIDGYTIGFLDNLGKLENSRILDIGAGTGNIDFKLIQGGAKEVIAIENTPAMILRLESKIRKQPEYIKKIKVIKQDAYNGIIQNLGENEKFDVELFRRVLYKKEDEVRRLLGEGFKSLNDDGIMFIVHPEADKRKYFDNGFEGIALSHVLKWHITDIGETISSIEYNRFTKTELETILKESCPDSYVKNHTPIRPAYNIFTIMKK